MNCPLPKYYLCHAAIVLIITAVVWPFLGLYAGLSAGAAFYVGREYTQWENGSPFDWKGLLAPLVICFIILIIGVLL